MSETKNEDRYERHETPSGFVIIDKQENRPTVFGSYQVDLCKDGKEHQWDGPEVHDGWGGVGSSCSKCGLDFATFMMRTGE